MKHRAHRLGHRALYVVLACAAVVIPPIAIAEAPPPNAVYDGWLRTSTYFPVRDGTKLAVDVYRPTSTGVVVEAPLPTILVATVYHRNYSKDGKITPSAPFYAGLLEGFLKQGYAVATLDMRGHGASFGTSYSGGMDAETNPQDMWDAIEWLAAQRWSNGNIGMLGCSYDGATAFWAASAMPPHLKAVAPCAAPALDRFNNVRFNGVSPTQLIAAWDQKMETLDVKMPALPVDDDKDHVQLDAAIAQHRLSWDNGLASLGEARKARPFRDTPPAHAETNYGGAEGWNYLANFKVSKIPVLQFAGWRDFTVTQVLAWYRSLADQGVAQKIVIGPWYHCEWYHSSLWNTQEEHVRWFDHWLKGKQNGVLSEAAVTYYVAGAPKGTEWRTADRWPLPKQSNRRLYFSAATAGGTGHSLSYSKPSRAGVDHYTVDYEVAGSPLGMPVTPSGQASPPDPGLLPIRKPALDAKSLTYTSLPIDRDAQLTGFPVVVLWVSSDAKDLDFFVDVEEVDEHDTSTLLTDGVLRASHATTRDPPYNNEGLPWLSDLSVDRIELDGTLPRKLEFALNPMSNYIKKGHRIRIAVNNFDKGSGLDTPMITPAPMVRLYRDSMHSSSVTLPFIDDLVK